LDDLGTRANLDEVAPADHLAADEAAGDVRMDRLRGLERRLAAAKRPGPRFVLAGREERDQVNGREEAAGHLAERRSALPVGGCLLLGQLGEFGLELRIQALRPVAELDQRLRRTAIALRDGVAAVVDAPSLVPGDVIALRLGDIVPADVRLLAAHVG